MESPKSRARLKAANKVSAVRQAASAIHSTRKPMLIDRFLRRQPVEPNVAHIRTREGTASLAMTPDNLIIIRTSDNQELGRYLANRIAEHAEWSNRQNGWLMPKFEAINLLTLAIFETMPVEEVNNQSSHPSASLNPITIVLHSRIANATGEQRGDDVTIRITDARLQAILAAERPCGAYDDSKSVGRWTFNAKHIETARAWMDSLR